jgi:hypothetical protein
MRARPVSGEDGARLNDASGFQPTRMPGSRERSGKEERMDVFIASGDAIQAAVMDPNGVCLYTASDEQGHLFFKAEDVMDAVWTAHNARTQ